MESNDRVNHASTVSSPTPTAYDHRPSFSSATSISEPVSRPDTFVCIHEGCDERTYVSPSTLKKHDLEKHCNRKAICSVCHWEGPRKHRHPRSCRGNLLFHLVENPGGYACGWCDNHFSDHARWFKHIVEHQRQGELKSNFLHDVASSPSPDHLNLYPQAQSTFNLAVVAGSNQFSPSAESHNADEDIQSPALSNAPTDPELDLGTSPSSEMTDSTQYVLSPAASPSHERSPPVTHRHLNTIEEFDGIYAGGAIPETVHEDAPPSNFEFDSTRHHHPLPNLRHFSPPHPLNQESAPAYPLHYQADVEVDECAPFEAPPFAFVNPRFTSSDAGTFSEYGE